MTSPGHDEDQIGSAISEAAARVGAPPTLRAEIARRRLDRSGQGSRWVLAFGAATLATAASVAVLIGFGGSGSAVSQEQVVALALAPVSAKAPQADPRDPRFLKVAVGRVRFPDLGYGGFASGSRTDELAGKRAVTVRYATPEGDVGYTVVQSAAIEVPAGARRVTSGPVRTAVSRSGKVLIVMWRRYGHTCLLASRTAGEAQLLNMAAQS